MSDPIGALGRAGLGVHGGGGNDGVGGVGGGDALKKYIVDIGKGDGKNVSFSDTLTNAINQVSDAQDNSADLVAQFLRGEPVELHRVMAASEEAGIALETLVEMRNKFTDAYRSLISMQS